VAALIKDATGVEPAVAEGARGEFSIRVGDRIVAQKSTRGFPDDAEIVTAVRDALGA
jgi:predicted Rdx family selenoprotein